ncbi:MAG: YidC/Oxa1 family insertase periplasmic-domain containing protein [Planctomycetota bacterium]
MDRRTYTFIVASAAFLFFYLSLRAMIAPPVNPNQPVAGANGEVEEKADPDEPVDDEPNSVGDGAANADEEIVGIASTTATPKWFTLGSMNPADGFDLLIYFANQGGAIERIEVTARNDDGKFEYRRVDTRSGYLGYFAGQSSDQFDGVKVNVIGPGSPASLATAETGEKGIQVDDVILAVDGTPVTEETEIAEALEDSKPGDSVTVEVARGNAASPLIFEVELTEHPLDLVRLAKYGGDDQIKGNLSRLSCLMSVARIGTKSIRSGDRSIKGLRDPEERFWDATVSAVDGDMQEISFETTLGTQELDFLRGEPIRMKRSFAIKKGSYAIDMDMELTNLGGRTQEVAYRLDGPNGVTPEGWWYSVKISPNFGGAAARDIVYRTEADGHELVSGLTLLKQVRKEDSTPYYGIFAGDSSDAARTLDYIGVDAQYFAVGYLPTEDDSDLNQFDRCSAVVVADPEKVGRHKERAVNVSFFLESAPEVLGPGESITQKLRIYAGPKDPEVLENYAISDFVYYGWFAIFSKPLSILLHFLQSLVGNYGVAIILLTMIVRFAMFPISRNAAVNAQKMQELAPEMKKIAEKYKDDMEGRLKAQQALQKRVGFNPLAGCLPMFLQLPIFMGLYRALSVDIELRQKPFWSTTGWASNLAAPDQFYFWADWMPDYFAGRGTGWLGPYFNLLPIVVVILFITQQKLFMPPATDDQTRMTQKVMTFMTLFMGLFFFRVPAGLCIYFVASSLWGIGERLIVKRTLPQGKHFDLDGDGDGDNLVIDATATSSKSKQTLAEKLLERVGQKEPERTVLPPNKRKRPGGGGKKKR